MLASVAHRRCRWQQFKNCFSGEESGHVVLRLTKHDVGHLLLVQTSNWSQVFFVPRGWATLSYYAEAVLVYTVRPQLYPSDEPHSKSLTLTSEANTTKAGPTVERDTKTGLPGPAPSPFGADGDAVALALPAAPRPSD